MATNTPTFKKGQEIRFIDADAIKQHVVHGLTVGKTYIVEEVSNDGNPIVFPDGVRECITYLAARFERTYNEVPTAHELRVKGFKVNIKHRRVYSDEYFLAGNLSPKGGETYVVITDHKGNRAEGLARCRTDESYVKKTGVAVAIERALEALAKIPKVYQVLNCPSLVGVITHEFQEAGESFVILDFPQNIFLQLPNSDMPSYVNRLCIEKALLISIN